MSTSAGLLGALAAVTAVEWVAATLALGYLLLAIRQSAWCWSFAIASALLYLVVFARSGLYMQTALQVFYAAMAVYGWRTWSGTRDDAPIAITRWPARHHVLAWSAIVIVAAVSGALIAHQAADGWVPYLDAAIAWGSVLATWMVTRKILENWLYWIVLDAAMVALAAWQGLAATALLFTLYTLLAIRGYWQWRRDERARATQPAGQVTDWPAAEARVREALAAHAETAELAQAVLSPIDISLSNYAWSAHAGQRKRFVRLARPGTEEFGADLAAEARILHRVGEVGISPPVVLCDPSRRLLVTHWIEPVGEPSSFAEPAVVVTVGQALARLHALPVPRDLRVVRFDAQARMLEASLPATAYGSELLACANEMFARLDAAPTPLVLCHHDLHAENLLFDADDRLWLVDWEYAGLNDPVFDLASFASQCGLPDTATRALCAAYVQAGGVVDESRLELARWAFDYVEWLWYQGWSAAPNEGRGLREGARRAARIESSLRERASALLRCNNRGFSQY